MEEQDGTRWLVPGCMTRLNAPDGEACSCPTLADQRDQALRERDEARRAYRSISAWHDAIVAAVHAHPDGKRIMKAAADRSSEC
ncbi:hypothetical protein [Streptomyces sp. NPDC050600]|uniref:hypothetical protein n=1 Tax=Streptomyces sp. NPDC050600 TaxID=3157213 RepID=UPI00342EB2E6